MYLCAMHNSVPVRSGHKCGLLYCSDVSWQMQITTTAPQTLQSSVVQWSPNKPNLIKGMLCFVSGSMWRLPSLVGLRSIRCREEDPHHVSAEGAVWSWGGEASHRAPDHCGESFSRHLSSVFMSSQTNCQLHPCFVFLISRLHQRKKLRSTQ